MKFVFTQLRRLFVAALGFSFLGTQCLFAYQPENNFWVDRRKATQKKSSLLMAALPVGPGVPGSLAAQFHAVQNLNPVFSQSLSRSAPKGFLKDHAKLLSSLSTAHGTVRKISLGQHYSPTGPVVVHIQDVHMNSEAQWNIRETLRSLMGSGQVNLVALEGATEDIPLQPFVDYPHRKPVELAADYLLKENKISGPIHAALTAQGPLPRFLGIDDAVHYQANVQAYLDSAPKLEATRKEIKTLQAEIDAQKRRDFSVALRSFDQQVEAYRTGQVSLGHHVNTLVNANPSLPSPPIRTFLQALQIERTLDFHQVETQRARLVEQLASRLTSTEIQSLVAQTVAHRSGELGYADFYAHLKNLCQKQGIRLSDYPAMDAYVRYVLLAEEMNAESLLENMAVLEKTAYTRLAVTPKEKALVDRSRRAWLMGKLVDFSLIPSEWREYKGATPNEGRLDLASFESFYQEAQARDDAMSKKVLGTIVSGPPSSVTVLVTGGFHAERMAEQLTRQGVSVLSYVPKINKIDTAQGSTYLSVFTQEKTPLEKLFQGEKLFLAQKPIHYSTLRMECPALVVMATVIVLGGPLSITFDPQMAYALLGGLGLFAIQKTIGFDTVAGTVRSRGGKVFLKLQNGKNNISSFVAETPSTQNIFGKAVSTAQWLFMFLTRGDSSHTAHPSKDMTPGGGKKNPWKVILFDPLREQAKWFVLLLGGGTYLLASNSVLYVGGGFPLFFLALGVFGVLLTKGIVPLFLETEHPSYSEEQIMALVPIAEKISYWTLGAFILTYFALCPWGLNGVAEMGQFLSFISSPDAKIFVLSSIVGYVAGVAKHMMHNARTFSALEGRNLQFLRRGTLLPLSRAAAGNLATGPVAPHIKYPLNSSKREEILSSYYDLVANSLSTRTRQELVMEIVEKIKNDNNPFYLDYRSLLDDSARLNTDFPLLLYLVNLGIFAPLHANPFGYLNPSSQRGERWINLDPKGWDGMYYLGEPLYWSFGSDPNDFRWGNGDGIGVLQKPIDFIENFKKYFTKVSLPEVDITVGPTRTPPSGALFKGLHEKTVGFFEGDDPLSPAEMGDWVEAGRIGDRESLIQLLKDNSYARLLQNSMNGTHSDLVGLDAAVELTVSRRSALRDDRGDIVFPRTQLIMIAQKLRGLQSMLKYLSQKGQKKLALVIFYREMATVYGTPKNPIHAGIIKMISSGDYKDESTMVDFLESKGIEQALKEVQKLILSLFRSNFVSDSERESVIAGLKIAEKRRIGDKAVVAPKQKEPESLPANKPPVGELHVSLPDFITFRVNSSEKSTRIIERYFKNLSEVFRAGPDEKRELIEHIVADIRKLNTVFSTRYSGLLSDTPEMASNPELFMTLVNFAIFVPLGYCIDSNSDPTQPPEGYFQIDKKKWRAKEKFGQTVLYVSVIPKSPRAELARGVTLGVGVMNTTSTEEDAIGMSKRFIRSATALNIAQLKNIKENPAILSLLSQWVLNNSLAEGEKIAFKKRALMNSINHEKEVAVIDVLEEEAFVRAKLGTDHGGFDFRPVPLAMIREANLKNDSVLSHESDDTVLAVKTGLTSMSSVGRFLDEQGESPLGTAQLLLFLEKLLISPQGSAERKICDVMFGKAATPQTVAQELFEQGDWKTWLPWIIKLCDTARNNNFYSYEEQSAIIDEIQKARATQTVVDVPGNLFPDSNESTPLKGAVSPDTGSNKFVSPSVSKPDSPALAKKMHDEGDPLAGLAILVDGTSSVATNEPIVALAKTILPEALRQAWERSRELVFMGENLDTYLSVLQTTIQEFKRLSRDSPLGTAIFNEEARTQWEAMIELLQDQLLETLQTSFPSEVLPDQMKKFSEDLGFSEDQRKFLHFYSILYSPGRALSVRSLQSYWEGKTGREILDLQRSLLDKLGDADALPLEADEQVESPKDKIDFGPSGELTVNGYPVFLPPNYEPKGYSGGFSKDAKIERAIVVAIRTLSSHPETIFATRKGMGALGIHKSKPLSHTIFIKFVGQKAFVLWVGPFSDSHGVGIAPDTVVDQGVIQRAQELNKTTEGSVPLMLKHYRPNGEGEGSKLNFSFLGTSQTIAPMIFLFPILFVLAWSHAPLWAVVVAVIFVVGLGNVESGKFIRQSWKNVKKSPKLFFERVKSDPGEGKTSTSNLAKELAEVMIFADKGNSPGASERVIALLNGTPSRLNVESIVGPQGLGALAAVTESAVFRDSGFQNQFLLEMGRVFPKGFPLGLARRAVGHLALDSTTRVGAQGIAADADMKTKKGLMVVVTREMLKDLPNRVGSFEKAAQGKPVYWVAEDALVFQALQKVRPSANLLIRPRWVEREGTVVVVSGKALERFVNSTRFLQDFAIALPRGAQVDMDGIAAASVLRNAVFFFLDELLSGMKVDFNTLRTIDTVARRIASAA